MNKFSITPYHKDYFQDLIRVFQTNVPEFFDTSETEDLIHYLENEIEDYFVVSMDNAIIGAGGINYDQDQITARLSWDFLDKNIQNLGAGSYLTQFRINHVRQINHIQRLIVRTSQFADGFYHKQGFREIERKKDYWAAGYDLVVMELKD